MNIRQLAQQAEALILSIGCAVYGIDAEGTVTFVNPAAIDLLQWSGDELLGREIHPVIHHSQPNGEPYSLDKCPIMGVLKTGTPCRVSNEVFWKPDSVSVEVEYLCNPVFIEGQLGGAVVAFFDVTDRKRNERQLQKLVAELEHSQGALQEKIHELEQFEQAVVGRELKMIKLEKENAQLKVNFEEIRRQFS